MQYVTWCLTTTSQKIMLLKSLVSSTITQRKWKVNSIYFDGLQAISEALELSYPTVQKTVKKLRDKKVITKATIGQNAYELSAEADQFFKSISNNIQVVLTYEQLKKSNWKPSTKTEALMKIW